MQRRLRAAVLLAAALTFGPRMRAQTAEEVEPASLMTTPVFLLRGAHAVSQGTGFLFASTKTDGSPDTVFLVTNVHVLTGHPPLSTDPPLGDRIQFLLHEDQNDLTRVRHIELPLWDADGHPLWVSNHVYPAADVALVPMPSRVYHDFPLFVFTEAHTRGDIKIRPTSGATLIGYPFGLADTAHNLPVWKTGHVASEPSVDFDNRPVFLVDVSAFPGMSGSPVLAVANGIYENEDGQMRSGRVLKLLGIFSAMPTATEVKPADTAGADASSAPISLQLGYVWKASLIAEMAKQPVPR